jgi:hypothetical protein
LRFSFYFLYFGRRLEFSLSGGFQALAAEAPYVPQGKGAASAIVDSLKKSIGLFSHKRPSLFGKFGLSFKGSPAIRQLTDHSPRHQFTLSAVEGLGLRPRLCFARAIFARLRRAVNNNQNGKNFNLA